MSDRRRASAHWKPDYDARFWDRVSPEPNSGCWLWTGALHGDGYGGFYNGSRNIRAHRYAYEMLVSAVPPDMVLDHKCRVRLCVNPDHLRIVTVRENNLLGVGSPALNARKTHCKRGHEFTKENTAVDGASRRCLTCRKQIWNSRPRKSRRAAHHV